MDYLATIVLEALELWPFTLDILKIMASIPSFRNATLQQKPMLLETLLINAIDSKSGFDMYAATCVALLSRPLELPIPSKVPVFLLRCLEKAVQSLSPETIRPVYLLLSGIDSSYLELLPFDILSTLQGQMIEVLKSLHPDNHLASLLCLAVLAKLSSTPAGMEKPQPNIQSSPIDGIDPGSADRFHPARKFFSPRRAPKTLDLVVIKAITACSQSCQLSSPEIVESLKLSTEIVDAFDKKEKSSWLAGNIRKTKKFHEKILKPEIEAKVQCEALNFLVALSAGELLPLEVISIFKKYLLTSKADVLSVNAIGQCIILPEDASIRDILESLLALACDNRNPCMESLTIIDNALRLISVLTERIPTSSKLLKAVLQSVSSNAVSAMLRQYASQVQGPIPLASVHDHDTKDVCPLAYRDAQAKLHQSLTTMLLESALHASQCGGHFDASMMTSLLGKHTLHSSAQSVECTQRRPMNLTKPKISFFEAAGTPHVDSVSLNWREGLIQEMSRDVDCRYEGVIRIVGEMCRNLELRCNETEHPLREEQSKSRDLQARLEISEQTKAEFELQVRHHRSTFSALETERDCLANQLEATERRLKELGTSLDSIHQEFDKAKFKADLAAQAAVENARQQDLAYLATMTGKDEVLEERSLKLASTETHAKSLEQELNHMRKLEAENAEKMISSETHIESLSDAVSASERQVKDLQNELIQTKEQGARNITKITDLEAVIEELNSSVAALKQVSDRNESTISILRDQLQKAEVEASDLRLQHETYVSAQDAEVGRLIDLNRSSTDKWQSELEVAQRSAAAASEQNAATITGLHSKVQKLRKEREERAREFAEAQELSGRLVSLMGTTKNQMSSHRAESRTLGHEHDLPSSDASSPDLPAVNPRRPPEFNASSRTPKRIKRHQDSRTPTTRARKSSEPVAVSREHRSSTIGAGRVALADIGSKQRPGFSTPTRKYQEHHTPKNDGADEVSTEGDQALHKYHSDEESFGGADVFTSTDHQQLSASRREVLRHGYDETTTEF